MVIFGLVWFGSDAGIYENYLVIFESKNWIFWHLNEILDKGLVGPLTGPPIRWLARLAVSLGELYKSPFSFSFLSRKYSAALSN